MLKMSEEKKNNPPETFFLPPLKMVLAFFDKESRQREKRFALSQADGKKDAASAAETQKKMAEKNVAKLIEKLSEKEE